MSDKVKWRDAKELRERIATLEAENAVLYAQISRAWNDALEEAAAFVEANEVGITPRSGYVVAPSALDGTAGTHAGMAYAAAIRALRNGDA